MIMLQTLRDRVRFDRNEFSGAFGDIGTDFPLIVGMILVCGLDASSVLVLYGALQIFTGLSYGMPMPVQPLKAMAVIVITQKLSADVLYGGGLAIGMVMLLLTVTGAMDWVANAVPRSVVRGIQFGLGLQLAALALKDYVPGSRVRVLHEGEPGEPCAQLWLSAPPASPSQLVRHRDGVCSFGAAPVAVVARQFDSCHAAGCRRPFSEAPRHRAEDQPYLFLYEPGESLFRRRAHVPRLRRHRRPLRFRRAHGRLRGHCRDALRGFRAFLRGWIPPDCGPVSSSRTGRNPAVRGAGADQTGARHGRIRCGLHHRFARGIDCLWRSLRLRDRPGDRGSSCLLAPAQARRLRGITLVPDDPALFLILPLPAG